MKTFIITYNRQEANPAYPNYLNDTVRRLREVSDIKPIIINDGKSHNWIKSEGIDTRQSRLTRRLGNPPKGAVHRLTYANWLIHKHYEEDKLILEDDVDFTTDFKEKLNICISNCEMQSGNNFILSVYSMNVPGRNVKMHPGGFYGTQGMYYPEKISRKLSEWLPKKSGAIDILVGHQFVKETGVKLYTCTPSLLQHIGHISTGCQGVPEQHYSKTFVR